MQRRAEQEPAPDAALSALARPPVPWWRRWEHVAVVAAGLLAALAAGVRPRVVPELGRAATATVLAEYAAAQEGRGRNGELRAIAAWERLRAYRPNDPTYQERLVWHLYELYQATGQAVPARTMLGELETRGVLKRGDPLICDRLGALWLQMGKPSQAATLLASGLRRGSSLDPVQIDLRRNLAQAYDLLGRHDEAEQLLLGLRDLDPGSAEALNNLAYHYATARRNLDRAQLLAQEALHRHQHAWWDALTNGAQHRLVEASYLDTQGWVAYRQGRLADAEEALRRAVELSAGQPNSELLAHLAQVLYDRGSELEAGQLVERALKLQPNLDLAKKLEQQLGGGPKPPGEVG